MVEAAASSDGESEKRTVLVVGQKAVSKAEGRLVDIALLVHQKGPWSLPEDGTETGVVQIVLMIQKKLLELTDGLDSHNETWWTCLNGRRGPVQL